MPPTRIGHKKSRFGCIRCKQRHVKCDEQRPCGNCIRHHAECSLVLSTLTGPTPAGRTPSAHTRALAPPDDYPPSQRSHSASEATPSSQSPLPTQSHPSGTVRSQHIQQTLSLKQASSVRAKVASIREALLELTEDVEALERNNSHAANNHGQDVTENGFPVPREAITTAEWLGDIQLFYHYITTDGLSLSQEPRQAELWQSVIPDLAFDHESLMHGLLALSALHLAHIHPERKHKYTVQSARHQDIALSRLRNGLFNVTQHNIHERFLLAYLVMVFTYYSIGNPLDDRHHLTTQELGQSLFLGQGIMNLISAPENWGWMKTGPLASIMNSPYRHLTNAMPRHIGPFADRLEQLSSTLVLPMAGSPEISKARASCMVAVDALEHAYRMLLAAAGDDSAAVWSWPTTLPSDFRDFVCGNNPVALVILGHYAALVRCLDDRWHLSGWSERVFATLEDALDEQWRGWLDLPKAFGREDLEAAMREYRNMGPKEISDQPSS